MAVPHNWEGDISIKSHWATRPVLLLPKRLFPSLGGLIQLGVTLVGQ